MQQDTVFATAFTAAHCETTYRATFVAPRKQAIHRAVQTKATPKLQEQSPASGNSHFLSVRASENDGRAYEMHKLVQEATRYGLGRQGKRREQDYFSNAALQVVSGLFPDSRRELWEECERYVVHA